MSDNNVIIEFIVLKDDLMDGRIMRAKKDTSYQITFEDDYAIYFIAENELMCGITKAEQFVEYTKHYKENKCES